MTPAQKAAAARRLLTCEVRVHLAFRADQTLKDLGFHCRICSKWIYHVPGKGLNDGGWMSGPFTRPTHLVTCWCNGERIVVGKLPEVIR